MNETVQKVHHEAVIAARVILNFRRDDIDEIAREILEDDERGAFYTYLDPRRVFDEIHRRLCFRAKALRVEISGTTGRRIRLFRGGDTNVIEVTFQPIDQSGDAYCYVSGKWSIQRMIREQKEAKKKRLVSVPAVNDEAADCEPPNRLTRFKMSPRMLERVRRLPCVVNGVACNQVQVR